ncbi:MAG: DUF2203 domain-containing protein [Planctomycetaceae bacterium]
MVQFSANDDSLNAAGGRLRDTQPHSANAPRRGTFDVASANQMLPLVEQIVGDLMALSKELDQQKAQIAVLDQLPKPSKLIAFSEELSAIKESFGTDRQRLESCQRELASLGVKIDSLEDGAIDFPAYINRQPVMLCWKLGEPSVGHWHYPNEGFQHRCKIAGQSVDSEPSAVAKRS